MDEMEGKNAPTEITEADAGQVQTNNENAEEPMVMLGKYAHQRREFLKRHRKGYYKQLLLEDKLTEHLVDIEQRAQKNLVYLIDKINEQDPPPDREKDPIRWTGHMNMTRLQAEEIIDRQLIYREAYQTDN